MQTVMPARTSLISASLTNPATLACSLLTDLVLPVLCPQPPPLPAWLSTTTAFGKLGYEGLEFEGSLSYLEAVAHIDTIVH